MLALALHFREYGDQPGTGPDFDRRRILRRLDDLRSPEHGSDVIRSPNVVPAIDASIRPQNVAVVVRHVISRSQRVILAAGGLESGQQSYSPTHQSKGMRPVSSQYPNPIRSSSR